MKFDESFHILLAEDDEVDAENLKRALKKHDINNPLYIARDGFEAMSMLKGENGFERLDPLPRILITDINMPKISGIELLEQVREDDALSDILAFVITTSDAAIDINRAHKLNVSGYIRKPINFKAFIDAIEVLKSYWSVIEFPDKQ